MGQILVSSFSMPDCIKSSCAGGICVEPANPGLWQALGSASARSEVREYALSRSLQLDPKLVPAWCALARLYAEKGEVGLAGRCLTAARSQEPTAAIIWEGMGSLAALSPTGSQHLRRIITVSVMSQCQSCNLDGLQGLGKGFVFRIKGLLQVSVRQLEIAALPVQVWEAEDFDMTQS